MRIAVSGTHCSGKTTLVEDFLAVHTDYVHEPEPYESLIDLGEAATDDVNVSDFYRQLEWSVERINDYGPGARMIAERSPADFVAYMYALCDIGRARNDSATIESALEMATVGMARIDLLVVLPLNERDGLIAPDSEDLELREAMNDRLLELIADESSCLLSSHTRVIEVYGTRRQRLDALERAQRTLLMHNLFVYGTLRRHAKRTDAQQAPYELLSRNAQFLGEATVDGTLYDLGNYTGMVVPGSNPIIGDVFAIEPSQWGFVIARLDEYEGCTENDPQPHEYRRDVVQACLSSGEMISAWAYILNLTASAEKLPRP